MAGKTRDDRPLPIRFWAKVTKDPDGCWEWTGLRLPKGYGQVSVQGHYKLAHRISWTLTHGEIPPGVLVLHHCDNPPCVRPDHLWLGTHSDNMYDAAKKGRLPLQNGKSFNSKKTHCPAGHEYDYVDPKGRRGCRTCRLEQSRRCHSIGHAAAYAGSRAEDS